MSYKISKKRSISTMVFSDTIISTAFARIATKCYTLMARLKEVPKFTSDKLLISILNCEQALLSFLQIIFSFIFVFTF